MATFKHNAEFNAAISNARRTVRGILKEAGYKIVKDDSIPADSRVTPIVDYMLDMPLPEMTSLGGPKSWIDDDKDPRFAPLRKRVIMHMIDKENRPIELTTRRVKEALAGNDLFMEQDLTAVLKIMQKRGDLIHTSGDKAGAACGGQGLRDRSRG